MMLRRLTFRGWASGLQGAVRRLFHPADVTSGTSSTLPPGSLCSAAGGLLRGEPRFLLSRSADSPESGGAPVAADRRQRIARPAPPKARQAEPQLLDPKRRAAIEAAAHAEVTARTNAVFDAEASQGREGAAAMLLARTDLPATAIIALIEDMGDAAPRLIGFGRCGNGATPAGPMSRSRP